MTKFFEKWTKKQKIWVGTACTALVLLGGGVVLADSLSTKQAEAKVELQASNKTSYKKSLSKLVEESYADSTLEALSEKFDDKQSKKIKNALLDGKKEEKDKDIKGNEAQLTYALSMYTVTSELNKAFESDGIVKEGASLGESKGLLETLKSDKVKFYEKEQKRVEEVTTQLALMEEAKKVTSDLFADNTKQAVKEDVSREAYTAAVAKVEALKQEKLKTDLLASLAVVDAKLAEKEQVAAVEAEKVAQETAAVEAAAQKEQAAQAQAQSGNANNNGNNGGSSSNAGYNGDAGNSNASAGNSNPTSGGNAPVESNGNQNQGGNNGGWTPPVEEPGTSWEGNSNGTGGWVTGEGGNTWEGGTW